MAESATNNSGTPPVEYGPIQPGSGRGGRKLRERAAAIGAVLVAIAAKGKALLLLLPKLKLLTTFGTALVSIAAYALLWGWAFAAGFVALLFLHELGHVIQLRREGIKASAPMFIPFLGAVITAQSMGDDAAAEARVGLAGPILGAIASLVPLGIWLATGDDFWRALAYVGFFLNLFNLLPVLPLDGGRAMAALSPWMWLVGLAALVAITIAFPNPILLLILLFGGIESWRRWKGRKTPEAPRLPRDPGADPCARRRHLPRPGRRARGRRRRDVLRPPDRVKPPRGRARVRCRGPRRRLIRRGLRRADRRWRPRGRDRRGRAGRRRVLLLRLHALEGTAASGRGYSARRAGSRGAREPSTARSSTSAATLARRDEVIHEPRRLRQLPWLADRGIELFRGAGALDGERRVLVGDES